MFSNYHILVPPQNRNKGFKEHNTETKRMKISKAFNYRFSSNYFNILSLTYP